MDVLVHKGVLAHRVVPHRLALDVVQHVVAAVEGPVMERREGEEVRAAARGS